MVVEKKAITFDLKTDESLRNFSRKGIKLCDLLIKEGLLFLNFKMCINDSYPFEEYNNTHNYGIIKIVQKNKKDIDTIKKVLQNNKVKIVNTKTIDNNIFTVIDCTTIKL